MFTPSHITGITLSAALAICALFLVPASAAEEILEFNSIVRMQKSGLLKVQETIRVTSEGRRIRRGIFRDFPIRYLDPSGLWRHVGFKVVSITRNGAGEAWHTKRVGDHTRIFIGASDRLIPRGEHAYTITYETTRQMRFFKYFDEVFWNCTGNFWRFVIQKARCEIVLPDGAKITQKAAYTGRTGSRGGDYSIAAEKEDRILFETTRPLRRLEGLTVAVGFPKGVVPEPSQGARFIWRLWDNLGLVALMLGALAVVFYFTVIWQRVGRDPEKGVIIPLFDAPRGVSPAAASYIHYWGFETRRSTPLAFVAALVSLAVKNRVKIVEDDDKTITVAREAAGADTDRTSVPTTRQRLPSGERALERKLLGAHSEIAFSEANGSHIQIALKAFKSAIKREHEGVFFRYNYGYLAGGSLISLASLIGFISWNPPGEAQIALLIVVLLASLIGAWFLFSGLWRLLGDRPGGGSKWLGALMTLIGLIILVPVTLAPFVNIAAAPMIAIAGVAAHAVMNVAFAYLLRSPTPSGRAAMDHIEGFRLYLSVAEAERMNMADAPDMSLELFERFLPYAIALGVEEPWSDALSDHMRKIAPADQRSAYHPSWYSGRSFDVARISTATSSVASAIAASTASAMPQSSSGSSGGGFSGGGGGGGGGGGW